MSDKIIVEVKSSNPCLGCSQTCDECPYNTMSADEYADVEREAKEFILSLEISMRKNKEIKITI